MKKVKGLIKSMVSLLLGGLLVTSCQSEDFSGPIQVEGKGTITLDLTAMTGFDVETKAVNEADYVNKNNYTVEIEKSTGDLVDSKLFSNWSFPYTLDLGSYTVRAYYGKNYKGVVATQAGFYVEGESSFTLDVNEDNQVISRSVSLTCMPTHAKVQATFSSDMSTYYASYYVTYKVGNTETTKVDNTDPWYLLVNKNGETVTATIHLTTKEGFVTNKDFVLTKTKNLKPNQSWTLNMSPTYEQKTGSLGISITIDETTEDHEVVVNVPSDWV
ncbi:MAG: DUF4493 domain-containing protein [Parabacteroides sp.]|nr:DUF4493 domain-containing protein [Parabacteroides sp.]